MQKLAPKQLYTPSPFGIKVITMCKLQTVLWINTGIFALMGMLHLVRLVLIWPAQIGSWQVPLWLSGIGVVVTGCLVYLNAKKIKKG